MAYILDHTTYITPDKMSGIPSLTILPEEQKFNSENLLQWKIIITQLLGSKGLLGYIDGKRSKPDTTSTKPTTSPDPQAKDGSEEKSTPIYSTSPTQDE